MGLYLTVLFNPFENCTLGKTKKGGVSKRAVDHSKILGERLLFDISSPSTPTFGGKKHWLLVLEDSTEWKNLMLGSIKSFKTKCGIQVRYAQCDNTGENIDFRTDLKKGSDGY